jgi:hypothetical protein
MAPTAAAYVQRGARVNLLGDPAFETLATVPANSPWTMFGTSAIFATGRTGSAVQVKSTGASDSVGYDIYNAGVLRSVEIGGYFRPQFTGGLGRIIVERWNAAGATLSSVAFTSPSFATGAYSLTRTTVGLSPDCARARIRFAASVQHGYWDDVWMYRT